jgi:hypothetical protein
MTLVSSANNIGSAKAFILSGRSFSAKNNKGPRMDRWGTLQYTPVRKKNSVGVIFISTFGLQLLKRT